MTTERWRTVPCGGGRRGGGRDRNGLPDGRIAARIERAAATRDRVPDVARKLRNVKVAASVVRGGLGLI
jgi:hypothetical protein